VQLAGNSRQFWTGKCVIITGSSSGIGWALGEHLAARGAKTGLLARRQESLVALQQRIQSSGGEAAWATADVADLEQTRGAIRDLEAVLGPCDVLIASAGVYHQTHGRQFDPTVANQVVATNLQGVMNAIGVVLPGMVGRGHGHLAAVASVAGLLGLPTAGAYSASKAGLVILLRSLRLDLRGTGVQVTTVCPGYVDTPMITDQERATLRGLLTAEEAARRIARAVERGRAEYWFPWRTWLPAWLASLLPATVQQRLVSVMPEMEEAPDRYQVYAPSSGGGSRRQPQSDDANEDQGDAPEADGIGRIVEQKDTEDRRA
jgi:short-subunit dehydrogenase